MTFVVCRDAALAIIVATDVLAPDDASASAGTWPRNQFRGMIFLTH